MSGSQEILREYLIRLGYQTDLNSLRHFEGSLTNVQKRLLKVGLGVTGIVAATTAATTAFAYNMRKMYFESEIAGSSIKNLKGVEFGATQIGIASEEAVGQLRNLATMLQIDPGKMALVEALGVPVQGRDVADVANDLVTALGKMPSFVGAQYAQLFGIDPQTFLQMTRHLEEYQKAQEKSKEIYQKMGVDLDKFKDIAKEYASEVNTIGVYVDALSDKILAKLLPSFKEGARQTREFLDSTSHFFDAPEDNFFKWYENTWMSKTADFLTGRSKSSYISMGIGTPESIMDFFIKKGYAKDEAAAIAANLHEESGFNPYAVGDKGTARGVAQWRGKRQELFRKRYGHDLSESSLEEQLDFVDWELRNNEVNAGKHLERAKGAGAKARAFANAYERPNEKYARLDDRAGLAEAYLRRAGGNEVTLHQETNITVNGSNADAIAGQVVAKQENVNGGLVRDLKGRFQ